MLYKYIYTFIFLLSACSNPERQEIRKQDYAVSFKDSSQQNAANCLLEYLVQENITQKKCQLLNNKDTILIRLFGKPKGSWKSAEDRKTAEFATKLLANDFSKHCFEGKITKVQIGESFLEKKRYIEATSDGGVGFRDYKP
ncbi:MAG: hypothetical protein OHK0045_05250 [Raineya sp.]